MQIILEKLLFYAIGPAVGFLVLNQTVSPSCSTDVTNALLYEAHMIIGGVIFLGSLFIGHQFSLRHTELQLTPLSAKPATPPPTQTPPPTT